MLCHFVSICSENYWQMAFIDAGTFFECLEGVERVKFCLINETWPEPCLWPGGTSADLYFNAELSNASSRSGAFFSRHCVNNRISFNKNYSLCSLAYIEKSLHINETTGTIIPFIICIHVNKCDGMSSLDAQWWW